jgi:hypothetical protein
LRMRHRESTLARPTWSAFCIQSDPCLPFLDGTRPNWVRQTVRSGASRWRSNGRSLASWRSSFLKCIKPDSEPGGRRLCDRPIGARPGPAQNAPSKKNFAQCSLPASESSSSKVLACVAAASDCPAMRTIAGIHGTSTSDFRSSHRSLINQAVSAPILALLRQSLPI